MEIDRDDFAKECVEQALLLGVNPHYLMAVAELLSGINDDTKGNNIGPFRLTQKDWDAKGSEPAFDIKLAPDDINEWENQVQFAALQTLRAQRTLSAKSKRNPSPEQLYAVWPNAPAPPGKTLQDAIKSTAPFIEPAVDKMLKGLGTGPAVNTNLKGLTGKRKEMADLIIDAFAKAGYGKPQQIAAVANAIAESNLNPNAHATVGEDSVGLFQLNRNGGVGTGHSVSELQDPATNIKLIIEEANSKAPNFKTATTLQDAVAEFVRRVERPANPAGEIVKRIAIAQNLVA